MPLNKLANSLDLIVYLQIERVNYVKLNLVMKLPRFLQNLIDYLAYFSIVFLSYSVGAGYV